MTIVGGLFFTNQAYTAVVVECHVQIYVRVILVRVNGFIALTQILRKVYACSVHERCNGSYLFPSQVFTVIS